MDALKRTLKRDKLALFLAILAPKERFEFACSIFDLQDKDR
jgi:hypothetical protein